MVATGFGTKPNLFHDPGFGCDRELRRWKYKVVAKIAVVGKIRLLQRRSQPWLVTLLADAHHHAIRFDSIHGNHDFKLSDAGTHAVG